MGGAGVGRRGDLGINMNFSVETSARLHMQLRLAKQTILTYVRNGKEMKGAIFL